MLVATPRLESTGTQLLQDIKKGGELIASLNNFVVDKMLFDEYLVLAVDVQTSGCGLTLELHTVDGVP